MRGWILYRESQAELKPESYEIRRFLEVAAQQGIDLRVVRPDQLDLIVTRDDRRSMRLEGEVTPLPDFVLTRMGATATYFALAVMRHLERLKVVVINAPTASELVRDKLYTQQTLAASNLPVPRTMLVKFPVDVDLVEDQLGFPVVVKTVSGSKGSGVYLSERRADFEDLVTLLEGTVGNANLILQEFVSPSRGRDLRVLVIGGRVIACMQRRAQDGGFKANISRGGAAVAYESTPQIELLSLEASRLLGLDIAGVDLLFGGDHFEVCEVNTSPGFKGIETAYPYLNVAAEIFDYVRVRAGQPLPQPVAEKPLP